MKNKRERGAAVVEAVYAIGFFLILFGACFDIYLRFMSRSETEMLLLDFARAVEISPARDIARYYAWSGEQPYMDVLKEDPNIKKYTDWLEPRALEFTFEFDEAKEAVRVGYRYRARCFFCLQFNPDDGKITGGREHGGYWGGEQYVQFEKTLLDYNS